MKIAFIITPFAVYSGRSNGIRMQAIEWANSLRKKGHIVDLVSSWEHYNWSSYDIIHFFSRGEWLNLIPSLAKKNPNIVISPILDTLTSDFWYGVASHVQVPFLRLYSHNAVYRNVSKYIKLHFARSQYEAGKIKAGTYHPNISIVPLSSRLSLQDFDLSKKEDFCFHVSSFTQPRKNVMRLMEASVKYNFRLMIAGNKGTDALFEPFREYAKTHDNIKILGFLSEKELTEVYSRAKVFALPSISEGVGLVALEAAMYGCGIVITKIGGPKEYYPNNIAQIVNPYSVDEIGRGVLNAMSDPKQPKLAKYINDSFNESKCTEMIISAYESIISI